MSLHCRCDTALQLWLYVLFNISGTRGTKYVPFTIFVFKTTEKSTRCTYSQGLNLYEFQISRTLVDAQGVIQQPVCLNMARTFYHTNSRQTLLGG